MPSFVQGKVGSQTNVFSLPGAKVGTKQNFFALPDAGRLSNRNFFLAQTQSRASNRNFFLARTQSRTSNRIFSSSKRKVGHQTKIFCFPEAKSSLKQKFCACPSGISPKTPAATPTLCSRADLPVPTRSRQPHILQTARATALAPRPDGTRSPLCPPSAAAFRRAGQ